LVKQEVDIMMSLKHPNLMGLVEQAEGSQHKFIIMDFMNMDFYQFMDKFDGRVLNENLMKFCFYQICKGVDHLHQKKIAHRDLKPQNVFAKYHGDGVVQLRIGDFGFSRFDENDSFSSQVGTNYFLAPEIVRLVHGYSKDHSSNYTMKADIWSLGCLLFLALFGCLPFHESYSGEMDKDIMQGRYRKEVDKDVSSDAHLLINSIFTINPIDRPSVDMILHFQWFDDDDLRGKIADMSKKLNLPSGYSPPRPGETFLKRLVA
jgi:serine/threonine protein kinase